MKYMLAFASLISLLSTNGYTQPIVVLDKKAIAKSGENIALNLAKGQQHTKIRDATQSIHERNQKSITCVGLIADGITTVDGFISKEKLRKAKIAKLILAAVVVHLIQR